MWPFKYPYTNFHELNLDWILGEIQNLNSKYESIEKIKIGDGYIDAESVGASPESEIPADFFNRYKKVFFPSGTYYVNERIQAGGAVIAGGENTIFTGVGTLDLKGGNILQSIKFRGCNVEANDGDNAFFKCEFSRSSENTNDVDVTNGHASFLACAFDGGEKTRFGIWANSRPSNAFISCDGCTFKNYWLNGIFTGTSFNLIKNCVFDSNHVQTTPNGGGQIDVIGNSNSARAVIINCRFIRPHSAACGIETGEGANAVVVGCNINTNGGTNAIAAQNSGTVVAIGNTIENDNSNDYAMKTTQQARLISVANIFKNANTAYDLSVDSSNQILNDNIPYKPINSNAPALIGKVEGNISSNQHIYIYHNNKKFTFTVAANEKAGVFVNNNDLIKVGGNLDGMVNVTKQQYFIDIAALQNNVNVTFEIN